MEEIGKNPESELDWQKTDLVVIQRHEDEGNLRKALSLANVRKEGLEIAISDIEEAIKSVGEDVSLEEWEKEKQLIQEELDELNTIVKRLEADPLLDNPPE